VRDWVDKRWAGKWGRKVAAHERQHWGDPLEGEAFNKQQEYVRREIAVRSSGRGFLAVSARYPIKVSQGLKAISRYGSALSDVGLRINKDNGYVRLAWQGLSIQGKAAAEGITAERGQEAIATAVAAVNEDIQVYVKRKQMELVKRAVKAMVKQ